MFVKRWGILRSAIPQNITIRKTISLVHALAKLHNFCIEVSDKVTESTIPDAFRVMNASGGYVTLLDEEAVTLESESETFHIPRSLIDGGYHCDDVTKENRRRWNRQVGSDLCNILPRERLHDKVVESHKVRPFARDK